MKLIIKMEEKQTLKQHFEIQEPETIDPEKEVKPKKEGKGYLWMVFALGSGIIFGVANFFFAGISPFGSYAAGFFGPGTLACSIFDMSKALRATKREKGHYWKLSESRFVHKETLKPRWWAIGMLFLNTFLFILINQLAANAFKFAITGNMNTGILTTLYNLGCFFVTLSFYFIFKEKISMA